MYGQTVRKRRLHRIWCDTAADSPWAAEAAVDFPPPGRWCGCRSASCTGAVGRKGRFSTGDWKAAARRRGMWPGHCSVSAVLSHCYPGTRTGRARQSWSACRSAQCARAGSGCSDGSWPKRGTHPEQSPAAEMCPPACPPGAPPLQTGWEPPSSRGCCWSGGGLEPGRSRCGCSFPLRPHVDKKGPNPPGWYFPGQESSKCHPRTKGSVAGR